MLFGRPSLRNEARVYARLEGIPGIPACHGFEGPDVLVLEKIDAQPLGNWAPGSLEPTVVDGLARLVAEIHERGVAIADLHRSNVLVDDAGGLHLVDFALARCRPGPLVRALQRLDRHAAARLIARYRGLPEPRPGGLFGLGYRLARSLRGRPPSRQD